MQGSFYSIIIPEKLNMTDLVFSSRKDKSRTAILFEDKRISFNELEEIVNRIGNFLKGEDVGIGDKVLIRMPNHPLYIAINMAIIKIGAVSVPTSTLFRHQELEHIINDCNAKFAISTPELLGELEKVKAKNLKEVFTVLGEKGNYKSLDREYVKHSSFLNSHLTSKDDIAFILYTSGTTGFPKGIPHAHRWLIALGEPNVEAVMAIRPNDRIFTPIEMTWMWPWGYNFWFPLYRGASTCIYTGRFEPERTFEYIEKYKATHVVGNPTIYRRLLRVENFERKYDLSSLRASFSSGETVSPELYSEWKKRTGVDLFDCMGQTELHVFTATRPGYIKPGSMGKPLPGIPVGVVKEDGEPCNVNEIGFLAIDKSFLGLTPGYLNREDEWKSKILKNWYLTGDYAYYDEDGFLWYVSRTDDLIKSRGYLISPMEIEAVLQQHKAVFEVAVIGVSDPELREKIVAIIMLKEGFNPSEILAKNIKEFIISRIAPFKAPKEIIFVRNLPRTVTGKLMRKTLKELIQRDYEEFKRRFEEIARYSV